MNLKEFLRPNLKKICIWIVISIIIILTIFVRNIFVPIPSGPPSIAYGYPFPFYSAGGFMPSYWSVIQSQFLWVNLIIAYILSCIIVYTYNKFQGRKK